MACGGGEQGGGGGQRRCATKAAAATVCGGVRWQRAAHLRDEQWHVEGGDEKIYRRTRPIVNPIKK